MGGKVMKDNLQAPSPYLASGTILSPNIYKYLRFSVIMGLVIYKVTDFKDIHVQMNQIPLIWFS